MTNHLKEGFIEEVASYLPLLEKGIASLFEEKDAKEKKKYLEEVHRLTHTIKGAASMVGLRGLSHVALQMEEALDDLTAGKISYDPCLHEALTETVSVFRTWCEDYFGKGVCAKKHLESAYRRFTRQRGLEVDEKTLAQLLETVDEIEICQEHSPASPGDSLDAEDEQVNGILEDEDAPLLRDEEEIDFLLDQIDHDLDTSVLSEPEFPELAQEAAGDEDYEFEDPDDLFDTLRKSEISDDYPLSPFSFPDPDDPSPGKAGFQDAVFAGETEEDDSGRQEASGISPELLESFYEEAQEHLEDLESQLQYLETTILENTPVAGPVKEALHRIRRRVHTIKGASAVIGLGSVSGFAHAFEDILDWIYDRRKTLHPKMVELLLNAGNLLDQVIKEPGRDYRTETARLCQAFSAAGFSLKSFEEQADGSGTEEDGSDFVSGSNGEPEKEDALFHSAAFQDARTEASKTLRVGMERVDELVNLTGELMIATSGFDQKMDELRDFLAELNLSRDRIREIAREMELGYEVKALNSLHTVMGMGRMQNRKMGGVSDSFFAAAMERPRSRAAGTPADSGLRESPKGENGNSLFLELHGEEPGTEPSSYADFDTLELDRYTELNRIIRTLNEAVIDVGTISNNLTHLYSDLEGHLNRQRVILSELQNKVMGVRMTPMRSIAPKLRQVVREMAAKLGKKIRMVIQGGDIELDRMVWEKITDPLMHMLRNAADHGIEPPDIRKAMGKPAVATIHLSAAREGNQVVLRITDDGQGLNFDAIRESAKKAGIFEDPDRITREDLASCIFLPGFSTRETITEVSGRGVGMDVVRENIEDLKGMIRVESAKEKGTRFIVRIPLTLAAIRALLFYVKGAVYAIALNEILEIIRVEEETIEDEIEEVVRIGNEILPVYRLEEVLGRKEEQEKDAPSAKNALLVLIVESGGKKGAFVIDSLVGQKEIVIKSTGAHLRYVKGVSGVTIMGDGSVVPILNVQELFFGHGKSMHRQRHETGTASMPEIPVQVSTLADPPLIPEKDKPVQILVVDDSVSIRQVVSRLMEDQGWQAETAKDGIDALETLRDFFPDIIILDIEMPGMNGYEFLGALRADARYRDIPVVMLTSRTAKKHRQKALSLGAKGFIVKPYHDDEFIELISRLIERENGK